MRTRRDGRRRTGWAACSRRGPGRRGRGGARGGNGGGPRPSHGRGRRGRGGVGRGGGAGGVGSRHSLEPTQSKRFGTRWGDAAALEAALIQGVSRFRDPGRGQGLAGIRRYLARWDGKIAIRSGTARIAIVPKWDDDVPLKDEIGRASCRGRV